MPRSRRGSSSSSISSYASSDYLKNAVDGLSGTAAAFLSPRPETNLLMMDNGWSLYDPLMERNRKWAAAKKPVAKRRTRTQRQFLAALAGPVGPVGPVGPKYKPFRSLPLTRKVRKSRKVSRSRRRAVSQSRRR